MGSLMALDIPKSFMAWLEERKQWERERKCARDGHEIDEWAYARLSSLPAPSVPHDYVERGLGGGTVITKAPPPGRVISMRCRKCGHMLKQGEF